MFKYLSRMWCSHPQDQLENLGPRRRAGDAGNALSAYICGSIYRCNKCGKCNV